MKRSASIMRRSVPKWLFITQSQHRLCITKLSLSISQMLSRNDWVGMIAAECYRNTRAAFDHRWGDRSQADAPKFGNGS